MARVGLWKYDYEEDSYSWTRDSKELLKIVLVERLIEEAEEAKRIKDLKQEAVGF